MAAVSRALPAGRDGGALAKANLGLLPEVWATKKTTKKNRYNAGAKNLCIHAEEMKKRKYIHIYARVDRNEHEKSLSGFPDEAFSGPPL